MRTKNISRLLALAAVCLAALGGCSGGAESGDPVAVQSVAFLTGTDSGLQNRYAGQVVSQETLEIEKESDRTIQEVFVKAGDSVSAGQVLFAYDSEEIRLAIEQGNLEVERLENSIVTMESQIEELEKDRKNAPSSEKLSYTIEIQTTEANIKEAEYNIQAKKVEVERLQRSLENAEVTTTIDGVVQSINEEGYDNYGNPLPYMVIMQVGTYRVKGTVNEQNMWQLQSMVGTPMILRSRVDDSQIWRGTLESVDMETPETGNNNSYIMVSSSGDPMTQSSRYPFYVALEDSSGLMLGQHVYIEPDVGQENQREGLWLSSYYIVQDGDDAYVWAANGKDQLEKRPVTLGMKDEATQEYEITEGLTAEDYIAIPEDGLTEGRSVTRYDDASFGGGVEAPVEEIPAEDGMEELPAEEIPAEDGMEELPAEEIPAEEGVEALPEESL